MSYRRHIINKYVREGQYVQEGTPLYDVADLSTVWIQAQVYEDDIPFLPSGINDGSLAFDSLDVTASTRAYPDEVFKGKLTFVYPHVDEETRTITVRFELQNPEHKLRPGSTATVTLKVKPQDLKAILSDSSLNEQQANIKSGRVLAVPDSSIIDTGKQKIAYRESSPGVYEGVEVKVGPRMSSTDGAIYYPVLSGLAAGDLLVTSGSFLVDAETRLNPSVGSVYFGGSGGAQGKQTSKTTVRPSTPENPEEKIRLAIAKLPADDRKIAEEQRYCPILPTNRLGSMGPPAKVIVKGQPVFLCCPACKEKALGNPERTLQTVEQLKKGISPSKDNAVPTTTGASNEYDVIGKVMDVSADRTTVTIDHEEIPGLMPAMKMPYKLKTPQVADEVKPGDSIHGRLEVQGSDYVITQLHKR